MQREPLLARIAQDVLRLLLIVVLATSVSVVEFNLPSLPELWIDVLRRTMVAWVTVLLVLAIVRLVLPSPRPGAHRPTAERGYLTYVLSAAFAEVALLPLVRGPFWFFQWTRIIYLRVLGGDIAWSASVPMAITVRDPALVVLGSGCQLEPGVVIETALHGAGRVRVGRVAIQEGCLVGAQVLLLPGSTLGHRARIEPGVVIGESARVGVGATMGQGARLERGVDVGSYVCVGAGAVLSERVRVGDRARVQPGAWVQPDTIVPERENWAGVPARPLGTVTPLSVAQGSS